MRKYLGVLVGLAALGVMSWAQTPAQPQAPDQAPAQVPAQAPTPEATPIPSAPIPAAAAPPQFARVEFFAGGTYAETGLFNAGHWAGLPGWDASLSFFMTRWLALVVDGGELFGTSKIPVAVPTPFPSSLLFPTGNTFNVSTREYNFVGGGEFARRKYERWTPFLEGLYGHQGTRGIVYPISGAKVAEVGTGRAFIAGAGLDHKFNERYSLRLKADYLATGSQFPGFNKKTQDNFRFSVGVIIRNVRRKKRTLEDETQLEQ